MNFRILRTGFTLAAPSTKWAHVVTHAGDKIFVPTSVLLTLTAHVKITWGVFFFFFFFACGILVPWPGIEPVLTALKECSLNHWTVREIPQGALEISDAQEQPLEILKEGSEVRMGIGYLPMPNCLGNSLVHVGLITTALCKGLRSSCRQRINLKNIQATPAAQFHKNKWPNQKMGQRTKQTFLQRRHTDG